MSTYKGIVKTNKLTGSPVGVTIAEMINIKINYSIIFLGMYFLTLLYQIKIFNLRNPSNCLKAFKINNLSGLMVFLGFFTLAIDML